MSGADPRGPRADGPRGRRADGEVFYLTTPIYYVNATPHLGHAYTTIVADAMARWRRSSGERVWLVTGTDEHGEKIAQAAERAGETPAAYADRISAAFRETWERLGLSHDDFIRTTEARHVAVVQAVLARLWEAGEMYFGRYGGPYCVGCERFYTDKEIVDGRCPDHGTPLERVEEENYFFRMSRHQAWLQEHLERHPDCVRPERYRNELLGFLREPLQDLSISRPRARLAWGIPLPFDDRFVTYVWFDALLNYVSALGGPDDARFREFWPAAEHLIGKDILKPHGIYWPCMLRAAGLPVFRRLNVHGYWSLGGGKMSKSVGNVVEALALAERYGHDAFRYFLLREMPFGLDASFSEDALVGRLNADLANDLGNFVARATTLLAAAGGVPAGGPATAAEDEIEKAWADARAAMDAAMEEFAFHRALAALWQFLAALNRYVDAQAPWQLARDPARRERLDTVLATLAAALRALGLVLAPFLPQAALRIRGCLGLAGTPVLADAAREVAEPTAWATVPPGTPVAKLSGLFPRVEAPAARPAPAAGAPGASPAPDPGTVSAEEFGRLDLRVAGIIAAAAVPKSRKLLKLTLSLGGEERTVVAGIAEHYAPADLVGKQVVVVANLAPATLMGVESRGMVLAGSADGRLALVGVDRDLPPGARVR